MVELGLGDFPGVIIIVFGGLQFSVTAPNNTGLLSKKYATRLVVLIGYFLGRFYALDPLMALVCACEACKQAGNVGEFQI